MGEGVHVWVRVCMCVGGMCVHAREYVCACVQKHVCAFVLYLSVGSAARVF